MNTATHAAVRTASALLTIVAAAGIVLGASASPASAAAAGEVVASDTTTVIAASVASSPALSGPRATASGPRAITVVGHGGRPVTLSAKGQPIKRIPRPGAAPATFTGLMAGKAYLVRVGAKAIGTVTALDRPGDASNLSVRTTDQPTAVALNWAHKATVATGGTSVQYVIAATSATAPTVTARVGCALAATLPGLDPSAIYTFSVTPINAAGSGKATKATMTRSLASITGAASTGSTSSTASAGVPAAAAAPVAAAPAPATPAPVPTPSSGGGSSAPAAPRTTTIYVCPDGYAANGDLCQQTRAYTFHTESVPYTYHWGVVGSHVVHHPSTDPCNYLPNPSSPTGLDIYCPPGSDETVYDYGNIKDATPAGYTDNGTAWDHQVKDTPPAGFSDDGTQYVKTVAKVAQTVTV